MEKKDLYLSDEHLEKVWREPLVGSKDRHDIHITKASADYAVKKIFEDLREIAIRTDGKPNFVFLREINEYLKALKKLIEWEEKVDRYKVRYSCGNCNKEFDEYFAPDQKAPERITCPRCRVYAAAKKWG